MTVQSTIAPTQPRLAGEVDCTLRIIAINDIYQLENLARLKTCVDMNRTANTIVTCAGDFVAPSLLSAIDKGHGMVDMMNRAGVTHVTIGNHESNIPLADLMKRYDESKFVWINSNMPDVDLMGRPKMPEYVILDVKGEKGARKVGLIGVDTDDMLTFSAGAFGGCKILSPFDTAQRLAKELADQVDCIVPMTHLYMPDDRKLAKMDLGFPVIIGGHDHDVHHEVIKGQHVLKLGCDAKYFGIVDLTWLAGQKKPLVAVRMEEAAYYAPDPELVKRIDVHHALIHSLEQSRLAVFPVGVKMSSVGIRNGPTTMATYLCTAGREAFKADACFIRAGMLRGEYAYPEDQVYFTYGDLVRELPLEIYMVVVSVPGQVIQDTVRVGRTKNVGTGNLLHFDNQLLWDPQTETVTHIHNQPIDLARHYDLAVVYPDLFSEPKFPPLVQWAKDHKDHVPSPDVAIQFQIAAVEYWSSSVWLQLAKFDELDLDKDGVISAEELKVGLEKLYGDSEVADLVLHNLVACADQDGDGNISLQELLQATIKSSDWSAFDTDGDSLISREEFRAYLESLTGQTLEAGTLDQLFAELDHDESGHISRHELRVWITSRRAAAIGITGKGERNLLTF